MTYPHRARRAAPYLLVGLAVLLPAAPASGAAVGGASIPDPAVTASATCSSGEAWACRRGQDLELAGTGMDGVERVVFLGGKGTRDDRATRPRDATATTLRVRIPRGAKAGRLKLLSPAGGKSVTKKRLRILRTPIPQADVEGPAVDLAPGEPLIAGSRKRIVLRYSAPQPTVAEAVRLTDGQVVRTWPVAAGDGEVRWDGTVDGAVVPDGRYALRLRGQATASSNDGVVVHDAIFPIRGKHQIGDTEVQAFGGARNHGGHDVFARCGTPLVAVRPSTVQFVAFQDRAGHYVVLQDATGQSYAYMHLREAALVKKGDKVLAGQRIGYVGDTGRASGCHLHFELWTAPGWYTGGTAIDPLPELQRWDSFS